jgi:hypothetical protein
VNEHGGSRGDGDLRARFGELRADAERRAPSFRAVMERAADQARAQPTLAVVSGGSTSRRRVLKIGAWVSAAVAAALAGVLLMDRGPSEDEQFVELVAAYTADVSGGAWRSPTSGLLQVPGMDLVRAVPSIGLPVPDAPGTVR